MTFWATVGAEVMTFLRILAFVYVARLTIIGLELLLGEPYTTMLLSVVLFAVSYQMLRQRWRERG